MARGWESKSVEEQQAEMRGRSDEPRHRVSSARQKTNRIREGLLLSRKSLVRQLEAATHARHRSMLENSLAELDRQIAALDQTKEP
jgi:hypothetical protein